MIKSIQQFQTEGVKNLEKVFNELFIRYDKKLQNGKKV